MSISYNFTKTIEFTMFINDAEYDVVYKEFGKPDEFGEVDFSIDVNNNQYSADYDSAGHCFNANNIPSELMDAIANAIN